MIPYILPVYRTDEHVADYESISCFLDLTVIC